MMTENPLSTLAVEFIHTLLDEMKAITDAGTADHKVRLNALKEARVFLKDILPRLSKEDKDQFSHALTAELSAKLVPIIKDESRLVQIAEGKEE